MNQRNANGERYGYWEQYWANGSLCWRGYCKNDELIGYITFYNRTPINTIHNTSFVI
jgi:antitoxin component YwqK of YwqJK toxin-antitoxin module